MVQDVKNKSYLGFACQDGIHERGKRFLKYFKISAPSIMMENSACGTMIVLANRIQFS